MRKYKETKMVLCQTKTPSKRRVAEIIKNGTPKEKALLLFINNDMRYRDGEDSVRLLTEKQEERIITSYEDGSPEFEELCECIDHVNSIKMFQKDFVSWCRNYKENLILFTNFYNIFYGYWHECATMQHTLDGIEKIKELPIDKDKSILTPVYKIIKEAYLETKMPYATIKEGTSGRLFVDMTGEKGSLYANLSFAAKNCNLAQSRAKGGIKAIEEYATQFGVEEFIPTIMINQMENVMNGFNPDEDCYKELFTNHSEKDLEDLFEAAKYDGIYKKVFSDMNKYLGILSTYDDIVPDETFYQLAKKKLYERD